MQKLMPKTSYLLGAGEPLESFCMLMILVMLAFSSSKDGILHHHLPLKIQKEESYHLNIGTGKEISIKI